MWQKLIKKTYAQAISDYPQQTLGAAETSKINKEINKEIVIKKNCERYHFLENLYKKFAFSVDNAIQI